MTFNPTRRAVVTGIAGSMAMGHQSGCAAFARRFPLFSKATAPGSRIFRAVEAALRVGSELPCPLVEVEPTCPRSVKDDRN
jgi:hypothetical protein